MRRRAVSSLRRHRARNLATASSLTSRPRAARGHTNTAATQHARYRHRATSPSPLAARRSRCAARRRRPRRAATRRSARRARRASRRSARRRRPGPTSPAGAAPRSPRVRRGARATVPRQWFTDASSRRRCDVSTLLVFCDVAPAPHRRPRGVVVTSPRSLFSAMWLLTRTRHGHLRLDRLGGRSSPPKCRRVVKPNDHDRFAFHEKPAGFDVTLRYVMPRDGRTSPPRCACASRAPPRASAPVRSPILRAADLRRWR